MSSESERKAALELILHAANVGWLLQEDKDSRLAQVLKEVDELSRYLQERDLVRAVDLLSEMASEVTELRPLVQLFASPTSTTIRAMAYCVLRGADIKSVSFEYKMYQLARLRVELSDLRDRSTVVDFETKEIWDAEVLRHFGMMRRGETPYFTATTRLRTDGAADQNRTPRYQRTIWAVCRSGTVPFWLA
ncbi:MAG: hypothetical protein R3B70_34375 [Polyangiaceae bacterium]